ncbi:MAG: tryptophan synthase subunit alpha [Actinomycetaceae bacterium]|nr:tryptophan synthase subunit alpha [Actinomycetaceae bacterium]
MSSAQAIRRAHEQGRCAVIGYLTAGYPDLNTSIDAAKTLIDAGCDVIELGAPYSDPCMDGPTIQHSSYRALQNSLRTRDVFLAVEKLVNYGGTIMVMTYYNLMYAYGVDAYARDFSAAGGAGLITPDLPPEEGGAWCGASEKYDLERTYLVAPSSPDARLELISERTKGWVYAASTMGVTGARSSVDNAARTLVERTRRAGADLVCVGFGVKNGDHVRSIGSYADGVIIGSALIDSIDTSGTQRFNRLDALARELVEASYRTR